MDRTTRKQERILAGVEKKILLRSAQVGPMTQSAPFTNVYRRLYSRIKGPSREADYAHPSAGQINRLALVMETDTLCLLRGRN
jgi:hypothetical protein